MREWWRGCVIYQIYPRSFQDRNGDGIGDIPGITSRLKHVADLGADAVWLSPVFPSPMADMGYDVSDYTDIDPLFGTLSDFDAMIEEAHGLGLKVIIDQVLSHTSHLHPWFVESRKSRTNPKADWYVWADPNPDGTPPNNWLSVFGGGAWEWDSVRRQYYLHNFLAEQPDLNFHNSDVQDALLETMRFWLERGVDGFRLDTVNYYLHDAQLRNNPAATRNDPQPAVNPYDMQNHDFARNRPENVEFLKRMRALLDEYDERMLVGEVGERGQRAIDIMTQYTCGDDRLHMAYSFELLEADFRPEQFSHGIREFFAQGEDSWPCWSFSNHDVRRHVTRWAKYGASQDELAKLTAALLVSLRGTVCIYQGEELGLAEAELEFEELTDPPGIRFWPEYKGRDGCRTPIPWDATNPCSGFSTALPWLPVKPPQAARNVHEQELDDASVLHFYRTLLTWRRDHPALFTGTIRFLDVPDPALAILREDDEDLLLCVFNLSPEPMELTTTGTMDFAEGAPRQSAELASDGLKLGPNGFAYLTTTENPDEVLLKEKA
ncbi:alpha-glucosidase family protein [Amaricoccus macauensis]|uniref:alpha-glucosidase family protein n=1 Tax=Amaricoccus macauensis TaxID=57001 RepID=UPI003C7AF153